VATVQTILNRKAQVRPAVLTVNDGATVRDAVTLMAEHRIGGVPVLTGTTIAGIFTERDLLRRVVAAGRDPGETCIADVMTHPVVVANPSTPLDECAAVMTERRLRHLPIVDGDALVGMVTIGDVLALRVAEQEVTIAELNRYVFDMH
jgi:CBS domain-containing protein